MITTLTPFLLYDGQAEAAMELYISLFEDGRIHNIEYYGPDSAGREGTVIQAMFTISGQTFRCMDSPISHDYDFTPNYSMFVECETTEEVDRLFNALSKGGKVLMPLQAYDFSTRFAWLEDQFGVSWQLNTKRKN